MSTQTQEPAVQDMPTAMPIITSDALVAHERNMAKQKEWLDSQREEMIRCLNPAYAAMREHEKPTYSWTVKAKWLGQHQGTMSKMEGEQTVAAKDEAEAWAKFCEALGTWPSRRDAKP